MNTERALAIPASTLPTNSMRCACGELGVYHHNDEPRKCVTDGSKCQTFTPVPDDYVGDRQPQQPDVALEKATITVMKFRGLAYKFAVDAVHYAGALFVGAVIHHFFFH